MHYKLYSSTSSVADVICDERSDTESYPQVLN